MQKTVWVLFSCVFGLFLPRLEGQKWQRHSFAHPQMGTVFRLVFYTKSDSAAAARVAREVFSLVDSLNTAMSDYLPESELNRLCQTAGTGRAVEVSAPLWQVLSLSVRFSRQAEGSFDVSVGPLTRLWRRARHLQDMPDTARVLDALEKVGHQNIRLGKGRTVVLGKTGMKLDLGGIAQGYAADQCLKALRRHGIRRALADAGGDIALGAPPPGEKGWRIEVPGAAQPNVLRLSRCGITTSGASFRYFEWEGKRYSHIVDPRSGWPVSHQALVTVRARDATTADAWATAVSVLGKKGWESLKRRPKKVAVVVSEGQ